MLYATGERLKEALLKFGISAIYHCTRSNRVYKSTSFVCMVDFSVRKYCQRFGSKKKNIQRNSTL